MSSNQVAQGLQETTEVGASTNVATTFNNQTAFAHNSATQAPIIANQVAATGPTLSIRTQNQEYLTARVLNLGVIFAGLIATIPPGATWGGILRSSFTSGFTFDVLDNFTFYGAGSLNLRGGSVTQGFNVVTSGQGPGIATAQIRTLFTNNAGSITIPDPGALAKTLATTEHSHSLAIWTASNIATTLTDQNTTLGVLTPGVFRFEIAGKAFGMTVQLDQAVTAGTLTVTLFKNGVTTVNTLSFTAADLTPFAKSVTFGTPVSFAAGDRADVKWTTSVGFLPTGAIDFNAIVRGSYDQ